MPNVKSKSAGKQKVKAGPSGAMAKFKGSGPQKSAVSSQESGGGGGKFAKGGPSGAMAGFRAVAPQRSGRSGQA